MGFRLDKDLDSKLGTLGKPKKDAEGNWPAPESWPSLRAVVVCGTSGCPVEGIGFEVTLYVQANGSVQALCGRCEVYHADIRGDLTPVGQDIRAELMANPKLFRQRVDAFKKSRQDKEKDPSPKNP